MADPTTYQRIVLKFESPWNIGNEVTHVWQNKFNLSGSIKMGDSDSEQTALQLAGPIFGLTSANTSLIAYSYYPQGSSVTSSEKIYPVGTHVGNHAYYVDANGARQQLEVCVLARAYVRKGATGKPVYLRKYIHDVMGVPASPNSIYSLAGSADFGAWNTGAGPHLVVPVDPSTGDAGQTWAAETHLYTHQLRRGAKRKKVVAAAGVARIIQDLNQLGKDLAP
jgi:hypothetical protein